MKGLPLKHAIFILYIAGLATSVSARDIVVGSKSFAEGVFMGEIATQLMTSRGVPTAHKSGLGGTQVVWRALINGDIDVYPEYTGTLLQDQFNGRVLKTFPELITALKEQGIGITEPVGFSNSYGIAMSRPKAENVRVKKISDLKNHPELAPGFSQEFATRADGWPTLAKKYGLTDFAISSMEHELAYKAIATGKVDITDIYTTDAEIKMYDLIALEDDLKFFPRYDAVFLYRLDAPSEVPAILNQLKNALTNDQMVAINSQIKVDGRTEAEAARDFLNTKFSVAGPAKTPEHPVQRWLKERFLPDATNHLLLVFLPLGLNILVGIPLGIAAAKLPRFGALVLSTTGVLQTIPSLALLVFMIPFFGIGYPPALVALFLYGLLPIVRNTFTGIANISPALMESATALAIPPSKRLLWIELPLAAPQILAGIKISSVLNVGTATLGAIIGAGGFGEPIMIGIRRSDMSLVLQGAIPAALLAIVIQIFFEMIETRFIPKTS